jgi:uncharacterized protein (DUF2267 family)
MKTDKFLKEVQSRGNFDSKDEAMQATQATLAVLGQRLFGGEPKNLAAQLPEELRTFLQEAESSESFDLEEFFERISAKEGKDLSEASAHAKAVISVLCDAVTKGEIDDIRSQLPKDFDTLFEGTKH